MKNLSSKVNLDSIGVNNKDGISILKVYGSTPGVELAKRERYKIVDERTVLFLSGGSTPKPLYQILAKEKILKPGTVAMVDERFGPALHRISNELSIKKTGLLGYFASEHIPFFPILHQDLRFHPKGGDTNMRKRRKVAERYNSIVSQLFTQFPKCISILGLGVDGHTASIAPNRPDFKNPLFKRERKNLFVSEFRDPKSMSKEGSPAPPFGFGERITLTIHALSKMDLLILLVFGKEKKKALELLFSKGPIEEIPARFLKTPQVSKKTLLITDQKL